MAILTTQLPEIAFPFELDTLEFEAEDGDELSTQIQIAYDDESIIDEELYFDSGGKILIEYLASLLIDCIRDSSEAYTFSVTVGGKKYSCLLVACTVDLEKPAMQVLDESFMTPLMGTKTTYLNGEEFLTMYCSNGDVGWSVKADFISDDTLFSWDEKFTSVFNTTAVFARLCVSPSEIMKIFSQAEGKLLGYTVSAGKRKQRYIVKQQNATEVVHFLNSFLEEDTFYVSHIENEVKPTRTMVNIKGKRKVVYVDPSATTKATSYPLMDSELPLAEDLVCAKDVWLKNKYMLAITDNDFKHTSDMAELPRLSVTWQPSGKRLLHKTYTPPQTFDETFDKTYE
jgi:hypothetical protein